MATIPHILKFLLETANRALASSCRVPRAKYSLLSSCSLAQWTFNRNCYELHSLAPSEITTRQKLWKSASPSAVIRQSQPLRRNLPGRKKEQERCKAPYCPQIPPIRVELM